MNVTLRNLSCSNQHINTRNKKNHSRSLVFPLNLSSFLFISGIKLTFIFKKKKIIKYRLYARFYLPRNCEALIIIKY